MTDEVARRFTEGCKARGWNPDSVLGGKRGPGSGSGVTFRFERSLGSVTSWLPASRFASYALSDDKRWTAVDVSFGDEPAQEPEPKEVEIPDDIAAFVAADRPAHFTRNNQRSIFSVKHYTQRIRDGWRFDGWANEDELRRIAEARPPVEAA